jgi:hypothetical protein
VLDDIFVIAPLPVVAGWSAIHTFCELVLSIAIPSAW